MTVTVYRSSDASAPVLNSVTGTIKDVLDACLINGYGAKAAAGWSNPFSASPTQTDTITAQLNASVTTFSVTTGTGFPAAPFLVKMDNEQMMVTSKGAGTNWTVVRGQNGTNATDVHLTGATLTYYKPAVYVNGTGSTGRYWQIMHYPPSQNYGRRPPINMGESMSDALTFTNPMTTVPGSVTAIGIGDTNGDATARNWVVVADQKTCHLLVQTAETGAVAGGWGICSFGDLKSYLNSDTYQAYIMARAYSGLASDYSGNNTYAQDGGTYAEQYGFPQRQGHYVLRNYAGTVGAKASGKHTHNIASSVAGYGSHFVGGVTSLPYPYGINSALVVAPFFWHENDTTNYPIRGYMRGLWAPCHNAPAANNDTFSGAGALAGKTFEIFRHIAGGSLVVETSDTWP